MKKILILFFAGLIAISGVIAQEFEEVQAVFGEFADDLSSALPFASTLGLNWSDSYIGNFPHLGVALSVGAVGLPAEAFGNVLGTLTGSAGDANVLGFLPPELEEIGEAFGMPFPAVALEARLGGFILPFDIGLKVGLIPDSVDMGQILPAGMGADYQLIGADVRFRLVKEKGFIPEISVGGGINRLTGGVSFKTQENIDIASFEVPNLDNPLGPPDTYDISLRAPEFGFDWETTVFDIKAQISKSILWIVTPYLGVGMTMGESTVHGGAYTEVLTDPIVDWNEISAALAMVGEEMPQLTENGFTISSTNSGFAARVYGGTSINLLFLKLDVTGFYELLSGSLGLSAALRVQF
jgi:hypothetical protein